MALSRTKATPDMSSSWSGESLSKWISLSGQSEENASNPSSLLLEGSNVAGHPGFVEHREHSLNNNQDYTSQSVRYPETHYTYGHPALSPIGYHLNLAAIQPSSPSEGTISPTSQSEVYTSSQHSSTGITAPTITLSWNHATPGSGLPNQLNSPRVSPIQYPSRLPFAHPSSGVNSPFLSAVHSPVSGNRPAPHMTTLIPEQAFSAYSTEMTLGHAHSSQEQYVNMSDVASLGDTTSSIHRYRNCRSPQQLHDDSVLLGVSLDGFQSGKKRTREEDSLENITTVKRTRQSSLRALNSSGSDEEVGSDGDSDAYVPSRSTSPSFRGRRRNKRMSDSSYESSANGSLRTSIRPAFSLRQMEELSSLSPTEISTAKGQARFDFTHGGISVDSNIGSAVHTSNISKKSRGRKVPVDEGTVGVHGSMAGHFESTVSSFDLDSPNLYTLPQDISVSAYSHSAIGLGDVGPYAAEGHSEHVDGDELRPLHAQLNNSEIGELSAPKHGRPPARVSARGRYANSTEIRVVSGGIKKSTGDRRYVCTASGCGKCFVRGEHLKRHVRSLHLSEKPHKCPYPGCNKSFSRRDNLGQHARVHL
ncbi:hypothetical protein DFJ43DRAFT_552888 [Lentinula guzmanii]|uniref:C2H2-type domain-containing protein n=1 Tax=Lentinula guzmanii TaxID=2804957 RepID=A0AA38J833_9AGAR|nr:hypothetical protein DFJ43DRAFT_552888 [Lentinula guzmanii]